MPFLWGNLRRSFYFNEFSVRRNILLQRRARSTRLQPFQSYRKGADHVRWLFHRKSFSRWPSATPQTPENQSPGMARVSRLIGKTDTTAKRPGWQVRFRHVALVSMGNPDIATQKHETPLISSGVSAALLWSLASQSMRTLAVAASSTGFRPVSSFKGRCFGDIALVGPCCSWAGRDTFQQPVHHWHPLSSKRQAVPGILVFKHLGCAKHALF